MTILVDTGPLVADIDRRDTEHERVRRFLEAVTEPLIVPITVVTEISYMLYSRIGPEVEAGFIAGLARGDIDVEPVGTVDLGRASQLMEQYLDFPLGFVDATVVAVAERLNIAKVLTLDRRHFTAIRPRHVAAFELLP